MQRLVAVFTSFFTSSSTAKSPAAMSQPHVRLAQAKDANEVTKVFINAMQDNPSWPYRFPHRKEFPEDHWNYNLDLMSRFISSDYDDWMVVIVEAKEGESEAPRIASFAVWDVSYVNKRRHGPDYIPSSPPRDTRAAGHSRRDADPKHLAAFQTALKENAEKYYNAFDPDQLKLQILGTHPDFWRRGFATHLCKWGIDLAVKDRLAVTLTASVQGLPLYTHLGFRILGTQIIQAPGEDESIQTKCMVYDKPVTERAEL